MSQETIERPAAPELLSPVPFVRLAPSRRQILIRVAVALPLILALAGAVYRLSSRYPVVRLPALALMALWLLVLWEELRLWPARAPFKHRGVVLYKSPTLIIASALCPLMFLLPLAAALVYYAIINPMTDMLLRPLFVPVALLLALELGKILAALPGQWRSYQLQRRAREAALHQIPGRMAGRRTVGSTAHYLAACAPGLALVALVLYLCADSARHGHWGYAAGLLVFSALVLGGIFLGQRQRWGYDRSGDYFYGQRRRGLKWGERQRWPAANYIGIYLLGEELWLAGRSSDVLLAPVGYGLFMTSPAERLSAASGLPLLHRWPLPPAELFDGPK